VEIIWGRHAREGGHPVRRDVEIELKLRGILDHPLSRMMTTVQDAQSTCHAQSKSKVRARAKGENQMPEITVNMAAGRTDEQKAGMMRDITQALVTHLGVDAEAVVIQINEAPLAHKMKGGKTFVERLEAMKK
jgi:4-oxalocrotonate tautomerase